MQDMTTTTTLAMKELTDAITLSMPLVPTLCLCFTLPLYTAEPHQVSPPYLPTP